LEEEAVAGLELLHRDVVGAKAQRGNHEADVPHVRGDRGALAHLRPQTEKEQNVGEFRTFLDQI